MLHGGGGLEGVARPDHEVGNASHRHIAVVLVEPREHGGVERDRGQRPLPGHTGPHRVARNVTEVARVVRLGRRQDDLYAGLVEQRGVVFAAAELVEAAGQVVEALHDDEGAGRRERRRHLPRLLCAREGEVEPLLGCEPEQRLDVALAVHVEDPGSTGHGEGDHGVEVGA